MNIKFLQSGFSRSQQILISVVLLLALHAAYYFGTGLYQCQYSLFEDQGIINTAAKIEKAGFVAAFKEQMQYEISGRFRPLFVIYRVGVCALFGDNIQWHHHFFYSVFIFNTLLLFWWGLVFGFSPLLSLLFTLLVFTGTQSNVGWRLENGENFALLFLNGGIMFFLYGLNNGKRNLLLASGIFILLAVFSKESFIFCYGFLPLLYLSWSVYEPIGWKKIWFYSGIALASIGVYVFCIRFFIVDPDAMKYAGSSISLKDILELQFGMLAAQNYAINFSRIWQTLIFYGSYFQSYILLLAISTITAWFYLPFRKILLYSLVIVFILLIAHKLLYLRIVVFNIYLYPVIVVVGFTIINLVNNLFIQQKEIAARTLLIVVVLALIGQAKLSYAFAKNYSSENQAAVLLTDNLAAHCGNNPLYIQADPLLHVEFIYAIKTRLKSLGCSNEFRCAVMEQGDTTEALRIMKYTDPTIIPFLRKQFHKQFSKWITDEKPETSLDGKNIWVIIQRPERPPPKFKEVESRQYVQYFYTAPQFYTISVLVPAKSN